MGKAIRFRAGDLVTRDGTDIQRVLNVNDVGDLIEVECVKEPRGWLNDDGTRGEPWCRIGGRESNLARRYEFVGELVEGSVSPFGVDGTSPVLLPPTDRG